ncbi:MAG: SsrA-binding protein SmpB [bacterium]|nr:SsrA-binding protein SmpB [bacterium]
MPKAFPISNGMKIYSVNKRALFDYEVLEKYEAGIELFGFEVKAIKNGRVNLAGSYVVIKGSEAWLINASIPPYQAKNTPANYDPDRSRKLLLHKSEIKELIGKTAEKGLTLVPIRVYDKKSRIKIELALARHKQGRDKRQAIREREDARKIERAIKNQIG